MQERQTFDYPNPQMGLVLQHFYEDNSQVVDRAGQEFFNYVQAVQEKVAKEKIEQLFNEWFVYDFKLKTGKTPLETYVHRNPDDLSEHDIDLMKQAGENNFTGYFWIEKVDAKTQLLTIRECVTNTRYEIRDVTASQSVKDNAGLVAARLIQLDDQWYFASDPIYFFPTPVPVEKDSGANFIDVVKMHYGLWNAPAQSQESPPDNVA